MSGTPISTLPADSVFGGTEEFVVNDGGVTKKIAAATVLAAPTAHAAATAAHGATGAVVGTTNAQTLSNKTLDLPTIADFTNAQHDHLDPDDGGTLTAAAISNFAAAADARVQQPLGIQTPAYAASFTPAPTGAQPVIKMTLTGNITVNAPASPVTGMVVTFIFYQDATGGRTITWNSIFKNPPTSVTTANGVTTASFIYDGTAWV